MPRIYQPHSEILTTGIHVASRSVFLVGNVEDYMLKQVLLAKQELDADGVVVTFFLSTAGGNTIDAFAIYDLLRSFRTHVKVVGVGAVWSAGVLILQGGDERLLTPNSTLMIHEGHHTTSERTGLTDALRESAEGIRMGRSFNKVLAGHMGVTEKQFSNRYSRSTYLTAEEAVRIGLADRII